MTLTVSTRLKSPRLFQILCVGLHGMEIAIFFSSSRYRSNPHLNQIFLFHKKKYVFSFGLLLVIVMSLSSFFRMMILQSKKVKVLSKRLMLLCLKLIGKRKKALFITLSSNQYIYFLYIYELSPHLNGSFFFGILILF